MQLLIYFLLLGMVYTHSSFAQTDSKVSYETILDDFAKASVNNPNFQNGINVFIKKPESDLDALYQGFRITHTDGEYNGGWELLAAKEIVISQIESIGHFRAVLYLFKNKQYIALYREESVDKYYFRIFKAVY